MKKIITAFLMATLVGITLAGFSGCGPAKSTEMTVLQIDPLNAQIEYSTDLQPEMTVKPFGEPRTYIVIGKKVEDFADFRPIVRLTFEEANYNEWMAENWDGPYFNLENACAVEKPFAGEAFECQTEGNITSYLMAENMGDIILIKNYYIKTPNPDWPVAEVRVELMTEDFLNAYTKISNNDIKLAYEEIGLTAEQKERIAIADKIIASLKF